MEISFSNFIYIFIVIITRIIIIIRILRILRAIIIFLDYAIIYYFLSRSSSRKVPLRKFVPVELAPTKEENKFPHIDR